jgi:hypothetical protein
MISIIGFDYFLIDENQNVDRVLLDLHMPGVSNRTRAVQYIASENE